MGILLYGHIFTSFPIPYSTRSYWLEINCSAITLLRLSICPIYRYRYNILDIHAEYLSICEHPRLVSVFIGLANGSPRC